MEVFFLYIYIQLYVKKSVPLQFANLLKLHKLIKNVII